ncbi:MAG: glycoside hydrolase family 36 protein, partial [Candidatus Thermoplasmatota archaeon]
LKVYGVHGLKVNMSYIMFFDGLSFKKGTKTISPIFAMEGLMKDVQERYLEIYLEHNDLPRKRDEKKGGWVSYYTYFTNITEEKILNNSDRLCETGLKDLGINTVVIDDGWAIWGDWEPIASRFPNGMKSISENISKRGLEPGIWIAPFSIAKESAYATNLSIVVHDTGTPVEIDGRYILNISRQEAQQYLRNQMIKLNDWGYKYIKLDFLYFICWEFHNINKYFEGYNRAQAYRLAMQIITDSVTDDTYLLASGAPIGPSIGYFDAMRIGPDVLKEPYKMQSSYYVGSLYAGIFSIASRDYYNSVWVCDPDVVYLDGISINQTLHMWALMVASSRDNFFIGGDLFAISQDDLLLCVDVLRNREANYKPSEYQNACSIWTNDKGDVIIHIIPP